MTKLGGVQIFVDDGFVTSVVTGFAGRELAAITAALLRWKGEGGVRR